MPQILPIRQNKIVFQRSQTGGVPQAVLLHGKIRYKRILCMRLLLRKQKRSRTVA